MESESRVNNAAILISLKVFGMCWRRL